MGLVTGHSVMKRQFRWWRYDDDIAVLKKYISNTVLQLHNTQSRKARSYKELLMCPENNS